VGVLRHGLTNEGQFHGCGWLDSARTALALKITLDRAKPASFYPPRAD
jgi:hypothetical protein